MMSRGTTLAAVDTFAPKDETVQQSAAEPSPRLRWVLTALLLVSALLLSMFMQSILVVWSILGSTVAFLVAFILPAAFWYSLVGPRTKAWRRHAAAALLGVTAVVAVACFVLTCMNLDAPPCPVPKRTDLRPDVVGILSGPPFEARLN